MNSRTRVATIACCAAVLCGAQPAAEPPELADYAWGFPIQVEGDASFYSVRLPLAVNQSASDPLLRDAGVYNGEGRPVPRVFAPARDGFEESERRRRLPILPLNAKELNDENVVDLLFEQNGDVTTLQFHRGDTETRSVSAGLAAYIVDARELDAGIDALDFAWSASNGGFIGQIMVDASNDLRNWSLAGSAAIAELREDTSLIVQRRVNLDRPTQDFLRIRWQDMPDEWQLSGVDAVYRTSTTRVAREAIRLDSSTTDPADGGMIFELGGAPLVDRIQVLLTEQNVVVNATIYYWSVPASRWTRIIDGSFHHVGRGNNDVVSEPVAIGPLRASRFKVVIERGQKDAPLQLGVGWRPDTLLFVAQGTAPFTLAVGRADDSSAGFPQQSIFGVDSISELAEQNGNAGMATLGTRYPLGGELRMSVTPERNWSVMALWIGLALGVAFVSYMAYRIIRDQQAH